MSNPVGLTGATFTVARQISHNGNAFVNLTNPVVEIGQGWYKIDLTASETNADVIALSLRDDSSGEEVAEAAVLYSTTMPNHDQIAQQVWEYPTRDLTSTNDALKPTDIVPDEADLPSGNLTVLQTLSLVLKRFKRNKTTPKL